MALPLVLAERTRRGAQQAEEAVHVFDEASQHDLWRVAKEGQIFKVSGDKIEGFARRTSWENDESVNRLRDIMRKQGIARELERLGIAHDDIIQIAGHELEWIG